MASGRRPSTLESYSQSLDWLVAAMDDKPLRKITPSDLDEIILFLTRDPTTARTRSGSTLNRIKSVYRSFFGWCHATDRIAKNPSVLLCLSKTEAIHTAPITKGEVDLLFNAIQDSGERLAYRDMTLFAIYAYTGIRRSEALALRITDYSPDTGTLHLPETKGGRRSARYVPVPLARILDDYIRQIAKTDSQKSDMPLFPGRKPIASLTSRQVHLRFEYWKLKVSLRPELTIHSFRAGFATRLHEATGDVLLVSRALGHRDHRTAGRYIAENDTKLEAAIERIFA